ncbi:hypothetical protein Q579_02387, partial [Staphylococcus aureus M1529]
GKWSINMRRSRKMKKFNVQITYTGMIEETIETESLEETELR